jgi:hypothetical protein
MGVGSVLNGEVVRATSPVLAWSDDWLSYTRYDGVVLHARDIAHIADKPTLRALWRYVEAGGVLLVVGPGDLHLPKTWRVPPVSRAALKEYVVGFGLCLHAPEANPEKWDASDWQVVQGEFSSTNRPWEAPHSITSLHESFPVVDNLGVPITGLFVLMLVFAAVIGPINLIVLTRLNRRIWMLWTVPLVSFVTCLIVLVYMVFSEGWGGHERLSGVTILDQREGRATTLARSAYYSPLTPGDGLRFPEDTEVTPTGNDHTAHQNRCKLEWSGEQHFAAGWVTARIPAHFTLRRSEADARERLRISKNGDGTLSAGNALGADVRELLVADEAGNLYSCGAIPAGAEATLKPTGKKAQSGKGDGQQPGKWLDVRQLYVRADWGMKDLSVSGLPAEVIAPGTYLAEVDQTPFVRAPCMRGANVRQSSSLVVGIFSFEGR